MTVHSTLRNLCVAAGVAGAVGLSGFAKAGTTWDLPIVWPDGNFHTKNARMFADEVKKATGGDVVINIHSGGSLGFRPSPSRSWGPSPSLRAEAPCCLSEAQETKEGCSNKSRLTISQFHHS